ncbi:hypothetical protein [Bradyrhizobium sp. URHD0069]|uniref:hypothetical protein n=1 Tax=Bradyrhizobium sp. URHD0069 TaxID=1380355 RepID=UPI0004966B4D|nr:hypothetical protein [Bradyrhizobium sp. URHD0069]
MAAALIRKVEEQYPNISLHIIEAMTGTLDEWMQTARTVRCNSNHGPDAILAASVVVSQGTINMSSSKAVARILIDLMGAMIKNETWRARIIAE